jgi:hypothetical protein
MIKTIPQLNTNSMPRGLASEEVSLIEEAVAAIEAWEADVFDCACCGKTTACVFPTSGATEGPLFEIERDGSKISVTTTLPDGDEHVAEFASLEDALSGMRITIASAANNRPRKRTRKIAIAT